MDNGLVRGGLFQILNDESVAERAGILGLLFSFAVDFFT